MERLQAAPAAPAAHMERAQIGVCGRGAHLGDSPATNSAGSRLRI